ncbi:hypothetical protein OKE80_10630 [Riemerella anatipestifer]|uniref:Uncharacterized protein n=1 Tax=Riemerella anatipestifer TaxID=34085 RepID=A0AAP3AKV6_RIEAN|nr:hypothetical protein [Riemerella anatipestifer]MCQ4156151.1 hypothetical protein [Riemerella anatipestifer]MCQ4182022.1 hypothetical protein [Riemerella anatipestifer]MCU7568022.1 hypothetical protein [Riemerella anatipestifer]MCU7571598.1 hypothetical protein [Riemerella anatipestifer]MCW0475262.1 hypothetical protein [Riemerella anatipestifer]
MKTFNNFQFEFRKYQQKQDAKMALRKAKELEEQRKKQNKCKKV